MKKIIIGKLVRDKIPNIILSKGEEVSFHIADDEEFVRELRKKLQEEVEEFLESENPEELADILEVVFTLAKSKNISLEELENIRKEKSEKNGSFDKRIILDFKKIGI